jgi:hypothetical protein
VKMDLKEIGREGVNWIHLALDMNSCEHGNEPYFIKCTTD